MSNNVSWICAACTAVNSEEFHLCGVCGETERVSKQGNCTCDSRTLDLGAEHRDNCPQMKAGEAISKGDPVEMGEDGTVRKHSTEVQRYVDKAMFEAEPMETDAMLAPKVYLLSVQPDPLGAVAAEMMMYEGRVVRDLAEITDDERRHYYDECFKTALDTPLECIDFHFMVEGVTRAHSHQEVRQRTAQFAQESMRFAVKEEIAARPGPIIRDDPKAFDQWQRTIHTIHQAYLALIAHGIPAEEARGLLPHDTLTRLHHKVNLRSLKQELGKRTCTQAQFDWRLWAAGVRAAIYNYEGMGYWAKPTPTRVPRWHNAGWQFKYIAESNIFRPICFNTGKCMFRAQMDRGCTIRERVDAGQFDKIDDREWAADPTAAWVR